MTDNNQKPVIDEEAIRFSQQSNAEYLKKLSQCRLSDSQKEQIIIMLENGVKELEPDNARLDISIEEEKKRFVKAIEMCWSGKVVFEDYHKNYASGYVIREKTELALKYATKLREIIAGYDATCNRIGGIIGEMKLIDAVKEIESRLSRFLKEMKPIKHRFLEYSRDHLLIPGLVTVFSWYLGSLYFKDINGKKIRDDRVIDKFCDMAGEILVMLDVPAPSSGDTTSKGEQAQGRLRRIVKKICRELDDPMKRHPVNILLEPNQPTWLILPNA